VTEAEQLIQAAQKEALDSYRKEFEQLTAAFRDLDNKAQGTATTSGAFLAAILVYLNRPTALDAGFSRIALAFGLLGLLCALIFSLLALRIRKLPGSPSGEDIEELLSTLARSPEESDRVERMIYFYGDAARLWKSSVKERREINESKAFYIWSAQRSLIVTVVSVASLISLTLITD
jgi:hypothetical protein